MILWMTLHGGEWALLYWVDLVLLGVDNFDIVGKISFFPHLCCGTIFFFCLCLGLIGIPNFILNWLL